MATIQIADKPTLDSIKQDTTNILSRGGIKAVNGEYKIYDSGTGGWIDFNAGGGGNPILTIQNENMSMTGSSITVTHESGLFTTTKTMPSAASLSIEVPYLGIYSVKYPNAAGAIKTIYVEIVGTGNTVIIPSTVVTPFSTASWDEIESMIAAYYDGTIADLSAYWSVGDTKTISLSAMQAPSPNSSSTWVAQDITITILDFNHTDLATPINGHTKSAITLQTREVLSGTGTGTAGTIYVNGDSSNDTTFTKWSDLYMRTYLNDKVWGAFPSEVKSLIKPSKHYRHTGYNTSGSEEVTDNLFLPSYPEIFGTASFRDYVATSPVEGTQFEYYTNTTNRIKYSNNNGTAGSSAQNWWEGSASSNYASYNGYTWCRVGTSGSADWGTGNAAFGLAPAFAM